MLVTESALVRVVAPHFVAGIVMRRGRCFLAAPILRWCIGKPQFELSVTFRRLGYKAVILKERVRIV